MSASMQSINLIRSMSLSKQSTNDIGNREKEETKLYLGSLGKVAPQKHEIMIKKTMIGSVGMDAHPLNHQVNEHEN